MPHYYRLPSGRWRWVIQHKGNRRDGTADTKADAAYHAAQALIELGSTKTTAVDLTVVDLLHVWQNERRGGWSPTYTADVAHVLHNLPATFLARKVGEVTPPHIAALHRQLGREGWSPHRVTRAHSAINAAYKLAVAYGWAGANPARDLTPPTAQSTDITPPPHDVVRAILDTAPPKLAVIIRLAAVTGCRLGELVALRWDDLAGTTLSIRRAAVYTPATGLVVRGQTKTGRKGDRRLELDPDTVAMLAERAATDRHHADANAMPAPVYMFSHDDGHTPWRPGYVGLQYRRLRRTIPGAEHVRFHDLRHYVATTMLLDGENPLEVAAQLGHSNPSTTLRVYAHYLPGRGAESASKRAGRLNPRIGETP